MKNLINRASLGAKKTNYIFKARWLQGAASANESKKMQVNPRITPFRFACTLLLFLTLSIGNAWGAAVASQAPANGKSFIIALYYNNKYYALPHFTSGSTPAGSQCTLDANGKVTAISGCDSPDECLWTLVSSSTNYKITYTSGNNTYYLWKTGTTGNNYNIAAKTADSDNIWSFTSGTANSVTAYSVKTTKSSATKHTVLKAKNNTSFQVNGTSASYSITLLEVAPVITCATTSLSGFTYVQGSGPSAAQSFSVSGSHLTANITVTAPTNYEVSTSSGSGYGNSVTLTKNASGVVSATTVYVRLKSGLSANTYNGSISIASTGATTKSITLSGSVTAPASTWKFKYSGDSWTEHTMTESAGTASYSISLAADSRFEFGIDDNGTFYKNSGTIITTTSGWTFNTSDNNCKIHTGPAGTYTFAINTTTKAVTVTYPTVDHPNDHYVYFKNTDVWGTVYGYLGNSGNDNKAAAWPGSVMQATTTICGETYHYAALNAMSGTYNTIIFNNGSGGYGNQTSDLSTTSSLGKYNANQDANWHDFPTYDITFAGNGSDGGSMSKVEDIACGGSTTLVTNGFTKTGHTFTNWKTDVAITANSSAVAANGDVADQAVISNITSDITLTAQWSVNNYTLTWNLDGGTVTTAGTGAAVDATGTPSSSVAYGSAITAPVVTKAGYTFTGWNTSVSGTMPAANTTYTAQWSAKTDTYKTGLHTGASGWTTYASGVTESGGQYDIPNPGSVTKGATSTCEDTHYHFAGWVTDANKEAGTISGNIIAATGKADATGTTYWAVWEKEAAGGGGTSSITITRSTTGITATGYGSGVERTWTQSEIDFGGHYIMTNNANTPSGASASQYIVLQKSNGTLYNTEELPGAITEVEVIQYSELACNVYCGDERLMASDNTSTGQTPSGTLITKPDDATTMTWTISASNNYKFFALKAYTSSSSGTNYITSVKVTYSTITYEDPKVVCEACTADPVMTSAASALKGDFSLTSVGVTATGWNPGTNCSWDEKGFVWGSSANPTVSNNKVIVATGTDATWDGALVPSNSTTPKTLAVGTTYHFRAYGKNGKDAAAYVYSADVSFTPRSVTCGSVTGGTISAGTEVSAAGKTITLTATPANSHCTFNSWTIKKTSDNSDVTSSVSLSGQTSSATFTMPDYNVTITASFDEDAHATVNFYNAKNGNTPVSSIHVYEDEKPTPPTLTDGTSGDACDATSDKHYGWSTAKWNNTYATAELMNAAQTVYTKGSNLPAIAAGDLGTTIDYYAVWAVRSGSAAVTKTDEFTYTSFFDACTSSGSNTNGAYTNFSSISGSASDAVYAGNLMKHGNGPSNCKDYIQMRSSNSTSGIITTTTGGKAKKVTVEWNSTTTADKVLNIYGKSTAYSAASDLYSSATYGDSLGAITYGTSTDFTITGDYEYIGIRSKDGAIYFDAISIDWSIGGGYTYSTFLTTCCEDPELTVTDEGDDDNITLVREDIHGVHGGNGSATDEQGKATLVLDYTTLSSGTCTVEVKKLTGANNRATDGGSDCSNHTNIAINTSTKKITFEVWTYAGSYPTANGQGTYRIKITQAAASTYCDAVTYYFVDVTLRDKFVDAVNGNTTINVDGQSKNTSDYSKTPTESSLDADKNDDCHSTTRRLLGWVREDNMNTWYGSSSDRTANLDDKSADAALVAPNANIITTGSTWYAVWGEEVK